MPLRDKLRKVFHRDDDDSTPSSPASQNSTSSPIQSSRMSESRGGDATRSAPRPLSNAGNGSPTTNTRFRDASTTGINNPTTPTRPARSNADHQSMSPSTTARRSEDVMNHARISGNVRPARYSEDVADWNIVQANKPHDDGIVPAPLQVNRTSKQYSGQPLSNHGLQRDESPVNFSKPSSSSVMANDYRRKGSISRKAVAGPSSPVADVYSRSLEREAPADFDSQDYQRKPSSVYPADEAESIPEIDNTTFARNVATSEHVKNYAIKDAPATPSLEGVIDLRNTIDTTVDEQWAPAVVRETVNKEVHHIREEVLTREIHHHHVYHRTLPIIDVEVLPTRHFVPDGKGGLIEISEDEIPGRTGPYRQNWVIAETVSTGNVVRAPRRFTARQFVGDEGDYKEYVSAAGVPTTETTWVHPPTIETFSEYSGQSAPFYFDSSDPRDDGLRIRAPNGPVTGSSRLHVEQTRALSPPTDKRGDLSLDGSASSSGPKGLTPSTVGNSRIPQPNSRAGNLRGAEDPRLAKA